MNLLTKILFAAVILWAIAMTVYAQIQVKEASKLGFELGVLDQRLINAQEEAERQADMAMRAAAEARRAEADANEQREAAQAQTMIAQEQARRAEEAWLACQGKKK